jgi:hypothetical protein
VRPPLLALLFVSLGGISLAAQEDAFLVLEGGALIDGRGGAPIEDAVIVVRGERIWAVGRRGEVPIPAGANVIQTSGRTILSPTSGRRATSGRSSRAGRSSTPPTIRAG